MADCMSFPATVEEFMEQYKVTDTKQVYTNGTELVPIFRMKQWFEHQHSANVVEVVRCRDCIYQKPDTIYSGNWCCVHREPFMLKTLDGFCSYGERREEQNA